MKFSATCIQGCNRVQLERHEDSRGFFARTWCSDEFRRAGLPGTIVQCSTSYNRKAGTLRGMHFQLPPSQEGKLVRCIRGEIFDAVVDLRSDRESYLNKVTILLNDTERAALYIPPGCAHGFQALVDDTEVLYMMTDDYEPALSRGFRWDDPVFDIDWPISNPIINERDASYADFDESAVSAWQWQ
jgi:dTDP-4-dehydrorhamnose 3,5-epimerase